MSSFIIKNFGLVLFTLIYFDVITKVKLRNVLYNIICAFSLSILLSVFDKYNSVLVIPLMFASTTLLNLYKRNTNRILIYNLISFAFSYSAFIISIIISTTIWYFSGNKYMQIYPQLACFIINLCVVPMLFLFKRKGNSFSYLGKDIYMTPFVVICSVILLIAILLENIDNNFKNISIFLAVFIISIGLFLYWRTAITRHYLERLSLRNIDSLNAELVEKTNYIKELEEDKARIEKLNHKNYKLVPAMEGAVMHYLDGVKNFVESNADNPAFAEFAASKEMDMTGFIDEGNRLLGELNKMLAEWEDVVHNDDIDGKKNLPVCGVTRVDYILSYMYERSLKENFIFKVDVDSELTGLTEKIITDEDLGTLIADLIENAIIATKHNNGKDILVRLGMMKKEYTIEVYDSGIPFDKEVLAKYGYEQITTHGDESGSGIGMMQTYEILSKCGASLFIDEFAEGEGMYTKRISVVFNKKHQYVLYTKRSDEEVAYLKKRSDLMIVRK